MHSWLLNLFRSWCGLLVATQTTLTRGISPFATGRERTAFLWGGSTWVIPESPGFLREWLDLHCKSQRLHGLVRVHPFTDRRKKFRSNLPNRLISLCHTISISTSSLPGSYLDFLRRRLLGTKPERLHGVDCRILGDPEDGKRLWAVIVMLPRRTRVV